MRTKNLTFQENLVKMGVYIPIHSPDVPDIKLPVIPTLTKFSKISVYNYSAPPTYKDLRHMAMIQNESTTSTVSPKKYLVDLLKQFKSCSIFRRKRMFQIFTFWFEEDEITLYNYLK